MSTVGESIIGLFSDLKPGDRLFAYSTESTLTIGRDGEYQDVKVPLHSSKEKPQQEINAGLLMNNLVRPLLNLSGVTLIFEYARDTERGNQFVADDQEVVLSMLASLGENCPDVVWYFQVA